eukprot:12418046-Karenia_brevis.AAC.1
MDGSSGQRPGVRNTKRKERSAHGRFALQDVGADAQVSAERAKRRDGENVLTEEGKASEDGTREGTQ